MNRRRLLMGLSLAGVMCGRAARADDAVPAAAAPAPASPPAPAPAPSAPPAGTAPEAQKFDTWLADLRTEAAQRGFTPQTIEQALGHVALIPRVVELDHQQPEVTLTFDQYVARVVNDARAAKARQHLVDDRHLLARVARRYGVQPRFIVALWAIETDFGRITGNFPVIDALATLAYDGRRAAFFRQELFNALTIVQSRGISPRQLRGSWAGAMGQCQFMPSTYLAHAVDFDGNNKADIWTSRPDVFASIAHYLSDLGWRADETWGRPVQLPATFDAGLVDNVHLDKPPRLLGRWEALGVRAADGTHLPPREIPAWLIQPAGAGNGAAFLVYSNYSALLHWNRSLFFATAVGYLADRMGQG
jgi:membrane-bound lytic murein transglycosylase B